MKFSICIPNYNYGRFLSRTLRSVLDQSHDDFEIIVSDNSSTDDSVEIVRSFDDPRIRLLQNPCNVGFAGNLECASRAAVGDCLLLLSSDDLMLPGSLRYYDSFFTGLGEAARKTVVTSPVHEIDSQDQKQRELAVALPVWNGARRDDRLSDQVQANLFYMPARDLLRNCLLAMQNPFHFAATMYPRTLYDAVGGYGGGRLINPDKWFHWKLLSVADRAYYFDRPMSAYRVHNLNQATQQATAQVLKFPVDEYVSSFEISNQILATLGIERREVERAFIHQDVINDGMVAIAKGDRRHARRLIHFGRATYPDHMRREWKAWLLRALVGMGPVGTLIGKAAYAHHRRRNGDGSNGRSG